jgi:ABC-type dipeptide/oligopeptide/nickel transport system ATPase component
LNKEKPNNSIFESIHRSWTLAVWKIKGMQVYALVGKSGTGKSFRARLVAEKHKLDAIIDDGLLIHDQQILAGKSAKREPAYLAAVKTALFTDYDHRHQVKTALEKSSIRKVLIIGTSDRMVKKICSTLQLPAPMKTIYIEDIASQEEINTAILYRKHHGKHVIPVPVIEVRRNYPKLVSDSFRVMMKTGFGLLRKNQIYEKTIVRPEFSKRGQVSISESALSQMVMHCVAQLTPGMKIHKLVVKNDGTGYFLKLYLDVPFGLELSGSVHRLHDYIIQKVEGYTGIIIDELDIVINKITE